MPLNETKAQIFGNKKPKPKASAANAHLANQTRERSRSREEGSRSSSHSSSRQPIHPPTANAAAALKVPVPNTIPPSRPTGLKHQTSQSTLDDQENRAAFRPPIKQEPSSQRMNQIHGGNDEDTTDLTFGDSGWDSEGSYSGEPTARRIPAAGNTFADSLGSGWQAEADAERMRQGRRPVYSVGSVPRRGFNLGQEHDDTYSGIGDDEVEDDYKESVQNLENKTPSRTTMLPIGKPGAQDQNKKQVRMASSTHRDAALPGREQRHSSPLPERDEPMRPTLQQPQVHQNSIMRHHEYKQHVDSIPPPPQYLEPVSAPENDALKVSSYHEVSEEEQIPEETPQSTTVAVKRPYAEIDYEPEDLKSKSHVDLEQLPFLTDPRAPRPPPAVDMNGTVLSLPQRLTNLNKMRPEDQTALFHSLTDEENEETGQWFVQNFQDELKKLMERRLERRRIALKYEMEVKKRETVVKVKTSDVDDELKELRKGGGLLIEGKSVERIGGTPKGK